MESLKINPFLNRPLSQADEEVEEIMNRVRPDGSSSKNNNLGTYLGILPVNMNPT